jgi:hypothetical protein
MLSHTSADQEWISSLFLLVLEVGSGWILYMCPLSVLIANWASESPRGTFENIGFLVTFREFLIPLLHAMA